MRPDPLARGNRISADVVVASLLLALALVVLWEASQLAMFGSSGRMGPGLAPLLAGVGLGGAAISLLVQRLRTAPDDAVTQGQRQRAIRIPSGAVILGATMLIYVSAIGVVGFYVATFLSGMPTLRVFGHYGWVRSVAYSLAISMAMFTVFDLLLGVPVPSGLLSGLLR